LAALDGEPSISCAPQELVQYTAQGVPIARPKRPGTTGRGKGGSCAASKNASRFLLLRPVRRKERLLQGSQLWQAEQMAKAYRTDVVSKKKFQEEIGQRRNVLKPERVRCPLAGCECTYEMYGYTSSNREGNVAILQERLKREHPDHTSEVLAVNEFRRVPR
jgi:hypothetical protein